MLFSASFLKEIQPSGFCIYSSPPQTSQLKLLSLFFNSPRWPKVSEGIIRSWKHSRSQVHHVDRCKVTFCTRFCFLNMPKMPQNPNSDNLDRVGSFGTEAADSLSFANFSLLKARCFVAIFSLVAAHALMKYTISYFMGHFNTNGSPSAMKEIDLNG